MYNLGQLQRVLNNGIMVADVAAVVFNFAVTVVMMKYAKQAQDVAHGNGFDDLSWIEFFLFIWAVAELVSTVATILLRAAGASEKLRTYLKGDDPKGFYTYLAILKFIMVPCNYFVFVATAGFLSEWYGSVTPLHNADQLITLRNAITAFIALMLWTGAVKVAGLSVSEDNLAKGDHLMYYVILEVLLLPVYLIARVYNGLYFIWVVFPIYICVASLEFIFRCLWSIVFFCWRHDNTLVVTEEVFAYLNRYYWIIDYKEHKWCLFGFLFFAFYELIVAIVTHAVVYPMDIHSPAHNFQVNSSLLYCWFVLKAFSFSLTFLVPLLKAYAQNKLNELKSLVVDSYSHLIIIFELLRALNTVKIKQAIVNAFQVAISDIRERIDQGNLSNDSATQLRESLDRLSTRFEEEQSSLAAQKAILDAITRNQIQTWINIQNRMENLSEVLFDYDFTEKAPKMPEELHDKDFSSQATSLFGIPAELTMGP